MNTKTTTASSEGCNIMTPTQYLKAYTAGALLAVMWGSPVGIAIGWILGHLIFG